MTRDDGRDSEADESNAENDAVRAAAAETRVLSEEDAAETRLVLDEAGPADSEAGAADQDSQDPDAATVLAEDDDRTQWVARSASAKGEAAESDEASSARETRVLDPSVGPADVSQSAETRLIEESDKTPPPPVEDSDSARAGETPLAPPPPNPTPIDSGRGLTPGMVLFGEYEIVNVLGVGGMGEVYRARHRRLDEFRAIKVMHAELSMKKGASEFFYREAKALLAVRHPAVVHCHDLLSDDAGRVYLIMEMIEGIPLSAKMNDGPLSPDDVAILGARVSHGLSAAHRKGVIHRDISPDNIVLPNGRVQEAKIIDFGIAKLLQDGEGTIVDGFKGKLSYASPEQLGFFGGKIDGRSDFYSLGLVLVAAALGRPMGMGTTVVEAVDARRSFSVLPDEIPVGLRSAIQPLLALDPDDRPRYVDRLFIVPGGREGSTDPGRISTGAIDRGGDSKQKSGNRSVMIAGGSAAAALLVAGGLYLGLSGNASRDPSLRVAPVVADSVPVDVGRGTPPVVSPEPISQTPVEPEPVVEEKKPVVVAKTPTPAPQAAKPKPRRVTASDRIKIIGLINNARLALEENRLMSPANDNAYDRYRRVLELDPNEKRAKAGLRKVAIRYVAMADRSVDRGNLEQARNFADRARRADAAYPGIATLESRLSN